MTLYSLFCCQMVTVRRSLVPYTLSRVFPTVVKCELGEGEVDNRLEGKHDFVVVTVEYGPGEDLNFPVPGREDDRGWFDHYWYPPPL